MRGLLLAAVALAATAACSGEEAERARAPEPPPPAATPTETRQAEGEQERRRARYPRAPRVRVPEGFRAEVYARGLVQPTAMAYGPDGQLYVAQNGGTIVTLRPQARRPRAFAAGFRVPLGLAWRGRTLYVSAQGTLHRLRLARSGRATGRRTVVSGLPYELHQQDNVVLGPDDRL